MNRSDDLNSLDPTDLKILLELIRDPRIQIGELSDALGIARNTAQSRLRRLQRSGVLHDGGREIDLEAVGYDVVAFVTIEVTHRELDGVVAALRLIAQVLEVHEISGRGDVWCRVVATDTHNLQTRPAVDSADQGRHPDGNGPGAAHAHPLPHRTADQQAGPRQHPVSCPAQVTAIISP